MLARDPAAKALIFSQFTSMLDLVAFRLEQVHTLELSGSNHSLVLHVRAGSDGLRLPVRR